MSGRNRTMIGARVSDTLRHIDRSLKVIKPERFSTATALPPAREYEGIIVYALDTKLMYMSNGTTWKEIQVV